MKLVPVAVRVRDALPVNAVVGLILVSTGRGFCTGGGVPGELELQPCIKQSTDINGINKARARRKDLSNFISCTAIK